MHRNFDVSCLRTCINSQLLVVNRLSLLTPPRKVAFENIVGIGENAGYQHFLLFPQCFLSYGRQIYIC